MRLCWASIKSVSKSRRTPTDERVRLVFTVQSEDFVILGGDLLERMLHCGRRMLLKHE